MKYFFCLNIVLLLFISLLSAQSFNTPTGAGALGSIPSGDANTATGYYSMYSTTTAWNNSAHGAWSLYFNTTGSSNSAYGVEAMLLNSIGYDNVALGYKVLRNITTGIRNTGIGYFSLINNSSGQYNTGFGYKSLYSINSGSYNLGLGATSGEINSTGSYSSYIGYNTEHQSGSTSYSNSSAITARTYINSDNVIKIGDVSYIATIGGFVAWTNFSDRRIKRNINENVPGLSFIKLLRPVTFRLDLNSYNKICLNDSSIISSTDLDFKAKVDKKIQSGFIAQEVDSAATKIGFEFSGVQKPSSDNGLYSLSYEQFVIPLVQSYKELSENITALQLESKGLERELNNVLNLLSSIIENKIKCCVSKNIK